MDQDESHKRLTTAVEIGVACGGLKPCPVKQGCFKFEKPHPGMATLAG